MTPPVRYFRTTRHGRALVTFDGFYSTAEVPGIAHGKGFHADPDRAILFAIRAMH
jgi:putative SOS response-associated peptidase YedK